MRHETRRPRRAITWLARKLPTCEAVTATLSEALERSLTMSERITRRLHFLCCDYCPRYERQLRLMRQAVRLRASA